MEESAGAGGGGTSGGCVSNDVAGVGMGDNPGSGTGHQCVEGHGA
jgi:hypothetical protein